MIGKIQKIHEDDKKDISGMSSREKIMKTLLKAWEVSSQKKETAELSLFYQILDKFYFN